MTVIKECFKLTKENNVNYLRIDKSGSGVSGIVCYATAHRHFKFMRKSVLVGKVALVLFDSENKKYRNKLLLHQGDIIKGIVDTNAPSTQMFVIDDYVEFIGDGCMVWRFKFDTIEERDGFLCDYKQRGGIISLFSDDPADVDSEGEEKISENKDDDDDNENSEDNELIVLQKKLSKMKITMPNDSPLRGVKVYRLTRHETPLPAGK